MYFNNVLILWSNLRFYDTLSLKVRAEKWTVTLPLLISATLFFFFEKENIYFSAATKWMLIYLESNKTFMENSLWYSFI